MDWRVEHCGISYHLVTAVWSSCLSAVAGNASVGMALSGGDSVGGEHTGLIGVPVSGVCTLIQWDWCLLLGQSQETKERPSSYPFVGKSGLKWFNIPAWFGPSKNCQHFGRNFGKKGDFAGWINNSHLCLRYFSGLWKRTAEGGRLPVFPPSL